MTKLKTLIASITMVILSTSTAFAAAPVRTNNSSEKVSTSFNSVIASGQEIAVELDNAYTDNLQYIDALLCQNCPDAFFYGAEFKKVNGSYIAKDFTSEGKRFLLADKELVDNINSGYYTKQMDIMCNEVIANAGINDAMTDAQKVKTLSIYIGDTYKYDGSLGSVYTSTYEMEVMRDQKLAMCDSYSKLLCACLSRLNIPNKYLVSPDWSHAWAKVFVNGAWTEVDIAFNRKSTNKYIFFNSGRSVGAEF